MAESFSEVLIKFVSCVPSIPLPNELDVSMVMPATTTRDELVDLLNLALNKNSQHQWLLVINSKIFSTNLKDFLTTSALSSENVLEICYYLPQSESLLDFAFDTPEIPFRLYSYQNKILVLSYHGNLFIYNQTENLSFKPFVTIYGNEFGVLNLKEVKNGIFVGVTESGVIIKYDVGYAVDNPLRAQKATIIASLELPSKANAFTFNNENTRLAIGTQSGDIFLVIDLLGKTSLFTDVEGITEDNFQTIHVADVPIRFLSFLECKIDRLYYIVICLSNGALVLFDYIVGEITHTGANGSPISSACMDSKKLIIGSMSGSIRRYEVSNNGFSLLNVYSCHSAAITSIISFSGSLDSAKKLAVSSNSGLLYIFNSEINEKIATIDVNTIMPKHGFEHYYFTATDLMKVDEYLYIATSRNEVHKAKI